MDYNRALQNEKLLALLFPVGRGGGGGGGGRWGGGGGTYDCCSQINAEIV